MNNFKEGCKVIFQWHFWSALVICAGIIAYLLFIESYINWFDTTVFCLTFATFCTLSNLWFLFIKSIINKKKHRTSRFILEKDRELLYRRLVIILFIITIIGCLFQIIRISYSLIIPIVIAFISAIIHPFSKYSIIGNLLVLVIFVYLPSNTLSTINLGGFDWRYFLVALPIAFLTTAILNTTKLEGINPKKNIEKNPSKILYNKIIIILYILETIIPFFLIIFLTYIRMLPSWIYLTYITLPIALVNCILLFHCYLVNTKDPYSLRNRSILLLYLFGIYYIFSFLISYLIIHYS